MTTQRAPSPVTARTIKKALLPCISMMDTQAQSGTHYQQGYERQPCRHIPMCMGTLKGSQGHLLLKDVSCPVWSPQSDACPRKDHCKTDPQRVTRCCKPVKEGRRRGQRGGAVDGLHNITPRDPPPSPSMCTHHTTGKGDFLPPPLTLPRCPRQL